MTLEQVGQSTLSMEDRHKGVFASEIAAIVGVDPWRTPYSVWCEKTGRGSAFSGNMRTRFGNHNEPFVLAEYAKETGYVVMPNTTTQLHPNLSWVGCTPDAFVSTPPVTDTRPEEWLANAKTTSERLRHEWGQPGSADIPQHYCMQGQWEMLVMERDRIDFPTMFGNGQDFAVFTLRRNNNLIACLLERATEFLQLVQSDTPPEDPQSKKARDDERWGILSTSQPTDILLPPTDEVRALVEHLRKARAEGTRCEKEAKELVKAIGLLLGDASGFDGLCTWGYQQGKVDWKAAAAKYGVTAEQANAFRYKPSRTMYLKGEKP